MNTGTAERGCVHRTRNCYATDARVCASRNTAMEQYRRRLNIAGHCDIGLGYKNPAT